MSRRWVGFLAAFSVFGCSCGEVERDPSEGVAAAQAGSGGAGTPTAGAGTSSMGGALGMGGTSGGLSGGTAGAAGGPAMQQVPYRALAVSSGILHSCVLLEDHNVKCFGNNDYGQLGLGDTTARTYGNGLGDDLPFVDLGTGRTATAISTGRYTSCAVLDDGNVKCWGYSSHLGGLEEPLGDNPAEMGDALPNMDLGVGRTATQIAMGYGSACALLDDGNVKCWSYNSRAPIQIQGSPVVELAVADHEPVARFADGTVVGLLEGVGAPTDSATAVSVVGGGFRVCTLLDSGAAYCLQQGWGEWWPLTLRPESTALAICQFSYAHCVLTPESLARCTTDLPNVDLWWDRERQLDPYGMVPVTLDGRVTSMSSGGSDYVCAVLEDGSVKCWGETTTILGDGYGSEAEIPVVDLGTHWLPEDQVPPAPEPIPPDMSEYDPFCTDGEQSGDEGCDDGNPITTDECTNLCQPARCGDGIIWSGQEVQDPAVDFARDDCSVFCDEMHGAPGGGYGMVSGDAHTCARAEVGVIRCWGNNSDGKLGLCHDDTIGDAPDEMGAGLPWVSLDPDVNTLVVDASAGSQHSCAVLNTGVVKCWGSNASGQLGLGNSTAHGDAPGSMGLDLPALDLPAMATEIWSGGSTNCAYLNDWPIVCWGDNSSGQLGLGDTDNRGDDEGEMGTALETPDLGTDLYAYEFGLGLAHVCARLQTGAVKCWGDNSFGQLGLGDTENRGDDPGEMGDNLPAVELGDGEVIQLFVGGNTSCAMFVDMSVKCWGANSFGQLGQGDTDNRGDEAGEMGDNLDPLDLGAGLILLVVPGPEHTCASLDVGIKCWGANGGRLGLGTLDDRGDGPGEMGEALPLVEIGSDFLDVIGHVSVGANHTCVSGGAQVKCWGMNEQGQLGQNEFGESRLIVGDVPEEMGDALPFTDL